MTVHLAKHRFHRNDPHDYVAACNTEAKSLTLNRDPKRVTCKRCLMIKPTALMLDELMSAMVCNALTSEKGHGMVIMPGDKKTEEMRSPLDVRWKFVYV